LPQEYIRTICEKFSPPLNAMLACDVMVTLPSLLMMIDRVTAAFGMENRCPYLDYRIVEFAFSLPEEMKVREMQTKYILREASRGIVPEEIITRSEKVGLITPIGQWFSHELKDWKQPYLSAFDKRKISFIPHHSRGEFDRTEYLKICTEIWFETFMHG
jgi:asparagine synthase (glutamine-hydrolysing)